MAETGLSLGTPHYMSPEQATAERELTSRSDLYSLGAVLYEMLTGDPPHTGSTAQAIILKIVSEEAPSVSRVRKTIPANVIAAVAQALEKLPADRFARAEDFANALSNPGFRHGTLDEAAVGPKVRQWRAMAITASAVAVIFFAVAAWALKSSSVNTTSPMVAFTVPVGEGADVYLGGTVDATFGRPSATSMTLSPDGSRMDRSSFSRMSTWS
jgi:eukaryotic-like serine/threonine-protein kinase